MILHLFPKTQFTEDFVLFIQHHFNMDDHRFVLYTNKAFDIDDRLYSINNVYDYDCKTRIWLYKEMKKADIIVLHNLGIPAKELLIIGWSKSILQKSVWVIWGADLYCYKDPLNGIGDYIVEITRRHIAKNIGMTGTLTEGDHALLCKWYNCNTENVRLEYISEKSVSHMKEIVEHPRDKTERIRILLGNSATRSNCHIEALEILSKYKNENIEILAPLSYGDMAYADEVTEAGRKIFGDSFVPIREFIPKEDYYSFLNTVDIGIFNNNRQQGTGNIEALMYYKRKVYIREGTSMWDEWNKKGNYTLEDVASIRGLTFKEFVSADEERINNNFIKISEYFDSYARAKEWQTMFDMMSKACRRRKEQK